MAVTFVASGAWSESTTSVTPVMPTGWAVGDLLVCFLMSKYETASLGAEPPGWTDLAPAVNNTGRAAGNDNGNLRCRAFYRIAQAGDVGPTLAPANNNMSAAHITAYRVAAGKDFGLSAAMSVDDTVGTPHLIAPGVNLGLTSGDILHIDLALNSDVAVFGTSTISGTTGATLGAVTTNIADAPFTSGTDARGRSIRAAVTAGTSTGTAQVSTTLTGTTTNSVGIGLLVRIREIDPPTPATRTPDAITQTVALPAVTVIAQLNVTRTPNVIALNTGLAALDSRTQPVASFTVTPNPAVNVLDPLSLNGTASFDPDGTIATYLWELVSGPQGFTGTFSTPNASTTTFTPGAA